MALVELIEMIKLFGMEQTEAEELAKQFEVEWNK